MTQQGVLMMGLAGFLHVACPIQSDSSSTNCGTRQLFFARYALQNIRAELERPLGPLSAVEMDALSQARELVIPEGPIVPRWLAEAAKFREPLRGCVLRIRDGASVRYLKFLVAVLAPKVWLGFLELCAEEEDEVLQAIALHSGCDMEWQHCFWYATSALVCTNDKGENWPGNPDLAILEHVANLPAHRVGSDSDWVPFDVFMARHPLVTRRAARQANGEAAPRPSAAIIAENPWLQDILGNAWDGVAAPTSHGGASLFERDEVAEGAEEFDDRDVWAALTEARAMLLDEDMSVERFSYTLRGGAWTHAHTGMPYDSFRSFGATVDGRQFLEQHRLPQSATFSVARYGEFACGVLCRFWCARMAFLMGLAIDRKGHPDVFSDDALRTFIEPIDFADLAETAGGHLLHRINALRAIRP